MNREKRRPQRTCLGCGERDDQDRLIRLTATAEGRLTVDKEKRERRGGYLHKSPECWRKFLERKSHYRAFHVEISKPVKVQLITELKGRYRE